MKPLIGFLGLVLLLIAGGLYYQFVYPPTVLRRHTEQALDAFALAVATKDRAKISESLNTLMTEDALIHLDVSFFAVIRTQGNAPISQDFGKAAFIQFIDNVLYPLSDYSYTPFLREFALAEDRKTASVQFISTQWGDGASLLGGVSVDTRTSSNAECNGEVVFENDRAKLKKATCAVTLRTVPKPGQAAKIQGSSDALREYLQR